MGRKRKAAKAAAAEKKIADRDAELAKKAWGAFDGAAATAAGIAGPRVSAAAYRALAGKKPPKKTRNPEVDAREALVWALIGGGLAEATKVAIRRGAARYWVKSTGELPPGMKPKK